MDKARVAFQRIGKAYFIMIAFLAGMAFGVWVSVLVALFPAFILSMAGS